MARSGRAGANDLWMRTASRHSASDVHSAMSQVRFVVFALTVLLLGACARTDTPSGTASTSPVASRGSGTASPRVSHAPSAAASSVTALPRSVWQLRYLLLDRYHNFAYCDPDLYPVARDDEAAAAEDWWRHTDSSSPERLAILPQHGYHEPLTTSQRLVAYRDHKKLTVIVMTPIAGGYRYTLSIGSSIDEPDQTVTGSITFVGTVTEASRTQRPGGCPICLEAATRIATPTGGRLVTNIKIGDLVWTVDARGHRVAAPVERTIRRATPGPHLMLQLVLTDGRTLIAAGTHPDVYGHDLRELRVALAYDGSTVASTAWVASTSTATYDILPSGSTGAYWANGILVGSTLTVRTSLELRSADGARHSM
jgi:hypothetical protein